MPVIDIEVNIKQTRMQIENLTQEVFRLQGILLTFEGLKNGGLKTIDLPNDPIQKPIEELESIQEKPE